MRWIWLLRLMKVRSMHINTMTVDQAAGIRRMNKPKPVTVIAVASGKGGVGKTNVSVNLSLALAESGKKVMLLDADLGLANVDLMLGLKSQFNLSHVINGERKLEDIIIKGPEGLMIVPAASGTQMMSELSPQQHAGMIRAFGELNMDLDTLVIDSSAGISDSVVSFCKAAHEILVVVCDEPASLTDAYALIKVMNQDHGIQRFQVLANMVHSEQEGRQLFAKLNHVAGLYLDVNLNLMGYIPYDDSLKKSVKKQKAVLKAYPSSPSARAFTNIAKKVNQWPLPDRATGQLEFFVERLIKYSAVAGVE